MALVSPSGAYLRIRKIDFIPGEQSAIRYWVYRDARTRHDSPGPFDAAKEGDVRTAEVTEALSAAKPANGLSVADALLSASYDYIQTLDDFQAWADA